ncbi:MAG: UvrD-helicase domain-containing protein [Eubacterium sp.]|nr:UvrD-helicase domain-containing protein [Eubacterium sp.]
MTKWNKEQKQVIDSREYGKNVLVSAAAGSGKTAVLVERILESIISCEEDEYNNSIDDFLVVTFTRAAASQMKEKISETIAKRITEESLREYPDMKLIDHLLRQQAAVGRADICTLDSFSGKVVRENFNVLGIDPAFTVADGNMMKLIQEDITEEFFEELFGGRDGKYVSSADFCELAHYFFKKTSDSDLKEIFHRVLNVAGTMPEPVKWLLDSKLSGDISKMPWMIRIMRDARGQVETALSYHARAKEIADSLMDAKLLEKLEKDKVILDRMYAATDTDNCAGYKEFYEAFSNYKFGPNGSKDDASFTALRAKYSLKEGIIGGIIKNITGGGPLPEPEALDKEIHENSAKWIDIIVSVSIEIFERVMAEKHRKRQYEFSDISHFALQVLSKTDENGIIRRDENGRVIPSDIARAMSGKIKYIYVDEYQDSSFIQEDMINAIASIKYDNPSNVFMVGDVKQSIYRFRQASPALFIEKYNQYFNVTGRSKEDIPQDAKGVVIDLSTNYRSRRPVLEGTNYIFRKLMQRDIGGIDYDDRAALHFAEEADIYPSETGSGRKPLFMVITNRSKDDEQDSDAEADNGRENDEYEAAVVADKIIELMNDENFLVLDTDTKIRRRLKLSDIAIILRSLKNRGSYYEKALKERGIPVQLDNPNGYFETIEITTMLSMLRVIDNMRQDIPLAAVLLSPIGGLNNSELALVTGRINKKELLYDKCMEFLALAEEENKPVISCGTADGDIAWEDAQDSFEPLSATGQESFEPWSAAGMPQEEKQELTENEKKAAAKLRKFFDILTELNESRTHISLAALIRKILDKTGYDIYISALLNGRRRLANINLLMHKAEDYENNSFSGLFNFLRYIEKCKFNNIDFAEAESGLPEDDKVQITTIHKSKGLEYPVVFLSGLGHEFNKLDEKKDVFVDGDNHISISYIDPKRRIRDKSFMGKALVRLSILGKVEEEQRLLYVGMTRAREYLIMTGVIKKYPEAVQGLDYKTRSTLSTYLTWLIPRLHEKDSDAYFEKEYIYFDEIEAAETDKRVKEFIDYNSLTARLEELSQTQEMTEKVRGIQENYDQRTFYPYYDECFVRAKMSVSEIKKMLNEGTDETEERYKAADYFTEYADTQCNPELPDYADSSEAGKKESADNTAARRGTVIHKIYELMDFKRIENSVDMEKEAESILSDSFFTDDDRLMILESGDLRKLAGFAETALFKRMKEADEAGRLYKEAPFTMGISAEEINGPKGATTIVQGIIDAYFITEDGSAVLMDYKTDRMYKADRFIERYKEQLKLYAEALENICGLRVKEAVIYSIEKGEIKVF